MTPNRVNDTKRFHYDRMITRLSQDYAVTIFVVSL